MYFPELSSFTAETTFYSGHPLEMEGLWITKTKYKLEDYPVRIILGNIVFCYEITCIEVSIEEHDIQPVNRFSGEDEIDFIADVVILVVCNLIAEISPFVRLFIEIIVMEGYVEIEFWPDIELKINQVVHHVTPGHQVHNTIKTTVRGAERSGKGIDLVIVGIRITAGIHPAQHEFGG